MEVPVLLSDEVRDLAARAAERGSVIAFQSTLAAAAQAVQQALQHEEAVGEAALSLAHRDTLDDMTSELRAARKALESALDRQGRCLMPIREGTRRRSFRLPSRGARRQPSLGRPTWGGSLSDAIAVLDKGASCMGALASGQPAGAPSRTLGTATATLLREHHDRLAAEANRLS